MRRLAAAVLLVATAGGVAATVDAAKNPTCSTTSDGSDVCYVVVEPGDGWLAVAHTIDPLLGGQALIEYAQALEIANGGDGSLSQQLHPGRLLVYLVPSTTTTTTTEAPTSSTSSPSPSTISPTTSTVLPTSTSGPPTTLVASSTTTSTTTTSSTTTTISPTTTTATTTTAPPSASSFPTQGSVGTPNGWTPAQTISGNYTVSTAGAVIQDLRINGNLLIRAANVTVRRVEVNGFIDSCQTGVVIEDSTVRSSNGAGEAAISYGGYTIRRVEVAGPNVHEGIRAGGCGPVVIEDSWVHVVPPSPCGDWHGDGFQGYQGRAVTVRNSFLWLEETSTCGGTAAFFYPRNQGNTSATVDGLIVRGGGYVFRDGMPGSVRNLHIVNGSWFYGPVDVNCGALTSWQAFVSNLDANGQPVVVRSQGCTGSGT